MAFDASILDDEPAEIVGRRGVYSRLRGFECSEALRLILEEKDTIFRHWRAAFDKGDVDKSSHPLYVDPRYQQLSIQTNELFGRMSEPIIEARGLMRAGVESGDSCLSVWMRSHNDASRSGWQVNE